MNRPALKPAEPRAGAGRMLQVKVARRAPERDDGWWLVRLGGGEPQVPETVVLL